MKKIRKIPTILIIGIITGTMIFTGCVANKTYGIEALETTVEEAFEEASENASNAQTEKENRFSETQFAETQKTTENKSKKITEKKQMKHKREIIKQTASQQSSAENSDTIQSEAEKDTTTATTKSYIEVTTIVTADFESQPTTETTNQQITEPMTETVTEQPNEPVTESATENSTEPTTEPTSEPSTEPSTEPTTEPTTETVTEQPTEPSTESKITPQKIQRMINAYICFRGITVDPSLTPETSEWSVIISTQDEFLLTGITLKESIECAEAYISAMSDNIAGMYCYYGSSTYYEDTQDFYILYVLNE